MIHLKSGDIGRDLDPFDLPRAPIGVSDVDSDPDWKRSARQLVDILIAGARSVKQAWGIGEKRSLGELRLATFLM